MRKCQLPFTGEPNGAQICPWRAPTVLPLAPRICGGSKPPPYCSKKGKSEAIDWSPVPSDRRVSGRETRPLPFFSPTPPLLNLVPVFVRFVKYLTNHHLFLSALGSTESVRRAAGRVITKCYSPFGEFYCFAVLFCLRQSFIRAPRELIPAIAQRFAATIASNASRRSSPLSSVIFPLWFPCALRSLTVPFQKSTIDTR